jgi:hypothetical protein
VVKARRQSRRFRSRVIGLGILAALTLAALGSIGHAEARVPADNPRTDGLSNFCGEMQDRWDYYHALYRQRKAADPNDPSLSSLKGEMRVYEQKWESAGCRQAFGNIWFINPSIEDITIATGNLQVLQASDGGNGGGGLHVHDVAGVQGALVAR